MARRHSIGGTVSLTGIGLHLGRECTLTFHPASSGMRGSSFAARIFPVSPTVMARAENAVLTERHTQLGWRRRGGAHGGARAVGDGGARDR